MPKFATSKNWEDSRKLHSGQEKIVGSRGRNNMWRRWGEEVALVRLFVISDAQCSCERFAKKTHRSDQFSNVLWSWKGSSSGSSNTVLHRFLLQPATLQQCVCLDCLSCWLFPPLASKCFHHTFVRTESDPWLCLLIDFAECDHELRLVTILWKARRQVMSDFYQFLFLKVDQIMLLQSTKVCKGWQHENIIGFLETSTVLMEGKANAKHFIRPVPYETTKQFSIGLPNSNADWPVTQYIRDQVFNCFVTLDLRI